MTGSCPDFGVWPDFLGRRVFGCGDAIGPDVGSAREGPQKIAGHTFRSVNPHFEIRSGHHFFEVQIFLRSRIFLGSRFFWGSVQKIFGVSPQFLYESARKNPVGSGSKMSLFSENGKTR